MIVISEIVPQLQIPFSWNVALFGKGPISKLIACQRGVQFVKRNVRPLFAPEATPSSPRDFRALWLGLLILAFYFTSNILLYYQHLLVNMEQRSKKDLDSELVPIS